jgi:ABC-2 type transport system ATP-binding protein
MPIVIAEGLHKRYAKTHALRGLDLQVEEGQVCGLLGPNGAGKTTAVRILATLADPTEGRASIAGFDVVRQADEVRRRIGLAGQNAALDEKLTGRENLRMFGRLSHLSGRQARQRADELLERFDLWEAGDKIVGTYSGGMRRRLDLITSLIVRPAVLFLDEPTTGLDPRSRNEVWVSIRELVSDGTTVLLTTQYLDEADQLADDIAVVDHGRVIAQGSPDALKSEIGDRLDVVLKNSAQLDLAANLLVRWAGAGELVLREAGLSLPISRDLTLVDVVRELDGAGIEAADVSLRRPTLDEVFLRLTDKTEEKV